MANDNKTNKFELSIIIIAILIPVFLDSFPNLVGKIIPFLPIYLTYNIVTLVSFILGVLWFIILIIGLLELINFIKIFNISLKIGVFITIALLGFVVLDYIIYLILYWDFLLEGIIYLICVILLIIMVYLKKMKDKNRKFIGGLLLFLIVLSISFIYLWYYSGSNLGILVSCDNKEILGIKNMPPPLMSVAQKEICKVEINVKYSNGSTICVNKESVYVMESGIIYCENLEDYKEGTILVEATFYDVNGNLLTKDSKELKL